LFLPISSAAKSAANKVQRKPLPPKIAALLRESWWLILVGAALYLVLVLATYHRSDPGWSHQASGAQVVNAGGKAGAWLADLAGVLLLLLAVSGVMVWVQRTRRRQG
jgi:S-DNA-T family DNA segregation ATPase FtsK/SpoIIIE